MSRDFIKVENVVRVAFDSQGASRHEQCVLEHVGSQTVPLGQQCQLSPQSIASSNIQQPIKELEYSLIQQVVFAGQPVNCRMSCIDSSVCCTQYFLESILSFLSLEAAQTRVQKINTQINLIDKYKLVKKIIVNERKFA